nr:hypothetical protein [Microbacterium trichothecenolyticum]
MLEERLGLREQIALSADPSEPSFDDLGAARFVAVQHVPDLLQAHADFLARLNDAESSHVLVGVHPVPRRGPVRNDDTTVVPVPKDMRRNADTSGGLADLHDRPFRLDLRST